MGCSWLSAPLGDLISYIGKGIAPKYTEDRLSGVMVLGQKCIRNWSVDYKQARLHSEAEKSFKDEKIVRVGDVLVNATGVGSAGRVAQVIKKPDSKCITDGHVITLRSKRINPYYLGYFVKMKQSVIEQMAEGSTGQTEMNRTRLQNEIVVTFPEDPRIQSLVADFFLSIDRKIALSNQINDYLAELCETVAAEACHEPDGTLGDICFQVAEKVSPDNADIATYVSTESLLQNKGGRQFASSLPASGKVIRYRKGDTLVSNIRPYFKKVWFASDDGTCSGDVLVFRPNEPDNAAYLHSCLRQDRFFDHAMRGARGTKMPRGDRKQVMEFPLATGCSSNRLAILDAAVEQIAANDAESVALAELRDALLPKLMSGEIDVSQVEIPTQLNNHLSAG